MINMFKKIFILSFLILLPLSALARPLEVDYPVVPGVETPGTDITFPAYIEYLYYLIVSLAGIAILVAFIWGGLIYLTSSGSPGRMQQGKNKIYAGLGGLAIVFTAHLILTNIDPQFFGGEPQKPKLPTRGYCLRGAEFVWQEGNACSQGWKGAEGGSCTETIGEYKGSALETICCQIEPRTYCFDGHQEKLLPVGFVAKEISFREKTPHIIAAYFFPEETFQKRYVSVYNNNHTDEHIESEIWQKINTTKRSASVFVIRWLSGFHLYPDGTVMCQRKFDEYPHYMPLHLASSRADLGDHDDRVVSIERQTIGEGDDWRTSIPWVGIFFTLIDYRGGCGIIYGFQQQHVPAPTDPDEPVMNGGVADPACFFVGAFDSGGIQGGLRANSISSAHVFRRQPNTAKVEGHVIFYEAANYIVPRAGEDLIAKKITANEIQAKNEKGEIWTINLKYDQGSKKDRNQWGQEKILSVEMTENFIVVLNSEEDFKGNCTLLTEKHPNLQHLYVLHDEQAGAKGSRVKSIAIIPIQ